jgi:P pilus assembly chaperone PapD
MNMSWKKKRHKLGVANAYPNTAPLRQVQWVTQSKKAAQTIEMIPKRLSDEAFQTAAILM